MIWLAYFAGVVTLPVIVAIGWGLLIAFSRSNVLAHESACQWCASLWGEPLLPRGEYRLNVTQWARDWWHSHVLARRLPHRELWQMRFERNPHWLRNKDAWKKYGLRPISASKRDRSENTP